ncbi:MAG: DEAD/DEAH box helicase [Desulfopila sp.]|jgi:ATP-dependent RNA helicase DeaD|nr:DEAD/DEAH box helicase [Desulfopila sp.]
MSDTTVSPATNSFAELALCQPILDALRQCGYTDATEIQTQMIPQMLAGRDVVGQAQTGTGKTAAFALPLLNMLQFNKKPKPQILVLAPTRELAIQVSESFKKYGSKLQQLQVLPIFGGQEYSTQLRQLQRGVHVIVGTPGRVMDHIRRGSLDLSSISRFILDEADEMLKMGFLEDVEWILEQSPKEKQIALFSATMPSSIRRVAKTYLRNPVEITVQSKTVTATSIVQQYLITNGHKAKREALDRILEIEQFEGMLIFVRTRLQTVELAEHLASLGYNCGPLNGDIPQNQRLRMVDQLKSGKLDIMIATDVAARGLDVERISHVINYDVPFDTEAYIHRIGRTGRAGRTGKAILFLHPREKRMLGPIEKETCGRISPLMLPTISEINAVRIASFKEEISASLQSDCTFYTQLVEEFCHEHDAPAHRVAGALARMIHEKTPLLLQESKSKSPAKWQEASSENRGNVLRSPKSRRSRQPISLPPEAGMDRYRIEVGDNHGVKPGNIVGAIANEADIDSRHIGRISVFSDYSTVDLPYGMPLDILKQLQKARICNRKMQIHRETGTQPAEEVNVVRKHKKKTKETPASARKKKKAAQKTVAAKMVLQ